MGRQPCHAHSKFHILDIFLSRKNGCLLLLQGVMKHAWLKKSNTNAGQAGRLNPLAGGLPATRRMGRPPNCTRPAGLSATCTANFMHTAPVPLPCTNARLSVHEPWTIPGQTRDHVCSAAEAVDDFSTTGLVQCSGFTQDTPCEQLVI